MIIQQIKYHIIIYHMEDQSTSFSFALKQDNKNFNYYK